MKRLRRIAAALTLATAATTGALLVDDLTAPPADTAWGASHKTLQPSGPTAGDTTVVTPLDTAWG